MSKYPIVLQHSEEDCGAACWRTTAGALTVTGKGVKSYCRVRQI